MKQIVRGSRTEEDVIIHGFGNQERLGSGWVTSRGFKEQKEFGSAKRAWAGMKQETKFGKKELKPRKKI